MHLPSKQKKIKKRPPPIEDDDAFNDSFFGGGIPTSGAPNGQQTSAIRPGSNPKISNFIQHYPGAVEYKDKMSQEDVENDLGE